MKVKKEIGECKGRVELVTGEGDRLIKFMVNGDN